MTKQVGFIYSDSANIGTDVLKHIYMAWLTNYTGCSVT